MSLYLSHRYALGTLTLSWREKGLKQRVLPTSSITGSNLPVGELACPVRVLFPIYFDVHFVQRIHWTVLLGWIEMQIPSDRPDDTAFIQITKVVVNHGRIRTTIAYGCGQFHELLVFLRERKILYIYGSHRDIEGDPVQIGGIELDPAVIARIDVKTIERRFEERPIHDAGGNPYGQRQGREQRMKIRAVARFRPQTVFRAAHGRGFEMLGVLDPVVDVVQ